MKPWEPMQEKVGETGVLILQGAKRESFPLQYMRRGANTLVTQLIFPHPLADVQLLHIIIRHVSQVLNVT